MDNDQRPAKDDIEDEIERAIEDKREAVLAADATGMLASEAATFIPEPPPED